MSRQKILLATLFTACLLLSAAGVGADPSSTLPRYPIDFPILSPEVRLSDPSTPTDYARNLPAAAYDSIHRRYLVVWSNHWPANRDLYGRWIAGSGALVGPWFAISVGNGNRYEPAVAFSKTSQEYLVVWSYDVNGDGTKYDIQGCMMPANSTMVCNGTTILTWPTERSFYRPRVAWDSLHDQFMVISNVWDTKNSRWNDVSGRLVYSNGTMSDFIRVIQDPDVGPNQEDITFNPASNEYFVTWRQTGSTTSSDIYAARLWFNGAINRSAYALANEPSAEIHPTIANNSADAYFLAFMRYVDISSKYDLCFRLLNLYGNAYYAGDTSAHCVTLGRSFLSPEAENIPETDTWLVTTEFAADEGHEVFAMFIEMGDTTIDLATYVVAADTPGWSFTNPILTTGAPGFMIAYEGLTGSIPGLAQHIYGRILNPFPCFLPAIQR